MVPKEDEVLHTWGVGLAQRAEEKCCLSAVCKEQCLLPLVAENVAAAEGARPPRGRAKTVLAFLPGRREGGGEQGRRRQSLAEVRPDVGRCSAER